MALIFCIFLLLRNAVLERSDELSREELAAYTDADYLTAEEATELMRNAEANARAETQESLLNSIRTGLTAGDTMATTIRRLFPGELIVSTTDNRYLFFPIDDTREKHGFEETDFIYDEDGFLVYQGGDTAADFTTGIDVSQYQGKIEWDRVAADGVRFAFVRAGLRRSRDGVLQADERFEQNIEGALAAGLRVGAYFYSSAVSEQEALEEAEFVISLIAPYKDDLTLPVAVDLEPPENGESRHFDLDGDQADKDINVFCEKLAQEGYDPLLYGNVRTFTLFVKKETAQKYPVWIAYYNIPQYYPYEFDMWQYSSHGKVDGIEGEVDLNLWVNRF